MELTCQPFFDIAASHAHTPAALRFLKQTGSTVFSLLITFLGLLAVTFVIARIVPIDPVMAILGERVTDLGPCLLPS